MDLADQHADVNGDRRPTETGRPGSPAPMPREQTTMPTNDGGGLHDLHGIPPAAPNAREQHPQESVGSTEPQPSRRGLLENRKLVAQGEDLSLEFGSRSEAGPNR